MASRQGGVLTIALLLAAAPVGEAEEIRNGQGHVVHRIHEDGSVVDLWDAADPSNGVGDAVKQQSSLAAFTPGNILVTGDNQLNEYTRDGVFVQSMEVPHPETTRRDATGVVVDRFGRVHVLNIAPFAGSYLSTYDPVLGTWDHLRVDAFLGVLSDGDLSILGDVVFTKRQRIDLITQEITDVIVPGRDVGEITAGLDGLIYVLDAGSPRPGVRVLDPTNLTVIRELTLHNWLGSRLDARGIAVNVDGTIYIADLDGRIYVYDTAGTLLNSFPTLIKSLVDIDLSPDGTIIAGNWGGNVVVTDITFQTRTVLSTGNLSTFNYVSFVPIPGERPDNDGDGVLNPFDNCPDDHNPDQADHDEDDLGDVCDPFPMEPDNLGACLDDVAELRQENEMLRELLADDDMDGILNSSDECPFSDRSAAVDARGCSLSQFCAGWTRPETCALADWMNDEPLNGWDCMWMPLGDPMCAPSAGSQQSVVHLKSRD